METVPNPAVRAAVQALDAFGAISQREARTLLGYWARRDQLTAADVEQVLGHYGELISRVIPQEINSDPTGWHYSREVDDVSGIPDTLPAGVDGVRVTGRDR